MDSGDHEKVAMRRIEMARKFACKVEHQIHNFSSSKSKSQLSILCMAGVKYLYISGSGVMFRAKMLLGHCSRKTWLTANMVLLEWSSWVEACRAL